jgi:hypothetical protein
MPARSAEKKVARSNIFYVCITDLTTSHAIIILRPMLSTSYLIVSRQKARPCKRAGGRCRPKQSGSTRRGRSTEVRYGPIPEIIPEIAWYR